MRNFRLLEMLAVAALLVAGCDGTRTPVDAGLQGEVNNDLCCGLDLGADVAKETASQPEVQAEVILPADLEEEIPLICCFDVVDGQPEDLEPEIAPPDIQPEYTPQEDAAFRVDSMVMTQPEFCYMMGGECLPVLSSVNDALAEAVEAGEMNVVGLFTPFGPGETVTLTMAQAECNMDDPPDSELPVGSCKFQDGAVPAEYADVVISTEAACASPGGDFSAPCFASGQADLALEFSGIVLGLSNVTVAGHVSVWPPDGKLAPGVIHGWLPEELAKTVQIQIPGGMPVVVTLFELLEHSPTQSQVVDGHNAWPVVIELTAGQVDFLQ